MPQQENKLAKALGLLKKHGSIEGKEAREVVVEAALGCLQEYHNELEQPYGAYFDVCPACNGVPAPSGTVCSLCHGLGIGLTRAGEAVASVFDWCQRNKV